MNPESIPVPEYCVLQMTRLPQANRPVQGRGHWRAPVGPVSRPK
ncbi:hypothetical protein [Photobacterium sp. 1_MG-2023]|nr:hypothetical protein [Photobacterium sp. 1_MG-2023]